MAQTLIFRTCRDGIQTENYWSTEARTQVTKSVPQGPVCTPYNLSPGTLLDSWCNGTTRMEAKAIWDGSGRPPRVAYDLVYTDNSPLCQFSNPCGLSLVDVLKRETSPNVFEVTLVASASLTTLEYSLNNFTDVQDSPVFGGLSAGNYVGYVRTKI